MQFPAPLTIREAAVADFAALAARLWVEYPADTPPQFARRMCNALTWYLHPEDRPADVNVRDMLPLLAGLYPATIGTPETHKVKLVQDALTDVLSGIALASPLAATEATEGRADGV